MRPDRLSALLIGNSRWHWAIQSDDDWHFEHCGPDPERLRRQSPWGWAAVGPLPRDAGLDPSRQITLADVPLKQLPHGLGVDRALAAWRAWRQIRATALAGVIVADAGTVLSLTKVTAAGSFVGGQLAPGLALQLQAMAAGTRDLPRLDHQAEMGGEDPMFPCETAAAMRRGALQASLGMLLEAQRSCPWPIWLCGGDAPRLQPDLERRGANVRYAPELVLEGLVTLLSSIRPGSGPSGSDRPSHRP